MKHVCILVLTLLLSFHLWGQESAAFDKITLNTGEVYVGEIIANTPDMVMIKAKNGTRYQFPATEVRLIEKISATDLAATKTSYTEVPTHPAGNFSGQLEVAGGISEAKNAFTASPGIQVALAFGNKKALGKNLFLGLGAGYNKIATSPNSTALSFIPLFARLQSTFSDKKTAPIAGLDAGYSLSANHAFRGGILIKASAGIIHRLNYKTSVIAGIYAGLQSISGDLTETTELKTYTYHGNTMMQNLGVKLGLQF